MNQETGDLTGNKITTNNKCFKEKKPNNNDDEDLELTTQKKIYISPEERQQIVNELRLVPKKDEYF